MTQESIRYQEAKLCLSDAIRAIEPSIIRSALVFPLDIQVKKGYRKYLCFWTMGEQFRNIYSTRKPRNVIVNNDFIKLQLTIFRPQTNRVAIGSKIFIKHFLINYFVAKPIMTNLSSQNSLIDTLIQLENPLIRLYIIKKSLQQELIRQIQINSYLQKAVRQPPEQICKIQQNSAHEFHEISTCGKHSGLPPKKEKKKMIGKIKNDTKNIPKNFGKAIITFVEQKQREIRRFLQKQGVAYESFYSLLKYKKRGINSIADLRSLWLEQHFEYAREMRMISTYFLKRGSLNYVFCSRIANHQGHIKYRNRLIEVLRYPHDFTSIKTGE